MKEKYHRLRSEKRKVIENLRQAGKTQAEIGLAIGFSPSSISKEQRRNQGQPGYGGHQANDLTVFGPTTSKPCAPSSAITPRPPLKRSRLVAA